MMPRSRDLAEGFTPLSLQQFNALFIKELLLILLGKPEWVATYLIPIE
jgi:hypothetical protein